MNALREISELENKILQATTQDNIIRVCMYCNNLISTECNNPIFLSDFQKKYLKENYKNNLSHGIDRECYDKKKYGER